MTSAPGTPDAAAPAAASGAEAAPAEGRFRAPHRRRTAARPRLRERVAVAAYRAGTWVLGRLPFGPSVRVGGWLSDVVYHAWPEKRRYVRANAGRVLGVPPDDPRAGALARAIFRSQTRWIVEGFHLPRMSNEEHVALLSAPAAGRFEAVWKTSNGLILVGLHLGNGDAAAAAFAGRGWPVNVLADDTAYEGLFELMFQQRRAWGIEVIRWRSLREVYRVLRERKILALLVDWGYRADGEPVRFLGGWTTFPSGPAVLAARTGATIVPFWSRRLPDGTFDADMGEPILVASSHPAEIARATQAIADELEPGVRSVPDQWCVFKPIWPDDPAEEAALAARADAVRATAEKTVAGPGRGGAPASGGFGAHAAARLETRATAQPAAADATP